MQFRQRWRIRRLSAAFAFIVVSALPASAQEPTTSPSKSSQVGQARLSISVTDSKKKNSLPCRITIVDKSGSLAPFTVREGSRNATRPGVIYTPDGRAEIDLAPGTYTVYASRGFEFGVDWKSIMLGKAEVSRIALAIGREVSTEGLVACDTHVHTFTHSGHGDASVDERAVTLAGEGVELPILTDHDHLTDLSAAAERMGVLGYFTPVVGDEVTTQVGHFNAFPLPPDHPAPGNRATDWAEILRGIRSTPGERVVVLNHPRDLHGKFRPFARENFNPISGEHKRSFQSLDALEVINSGAMQTDPMLPVRDWMALQNRGVRLTAVGSSDSHDVARHIVGQGRTYLTGRDDDPAHIDVDSAIRNLREGRALVSLGLLAKITVDDRFQPGDLARGSGDRLKVKVVVLGPSWTGADRIELFANGTLIDSVEFPTERRPGEKYLYLKEIPRFSHDVSLIAVATGPGVTEPYWPIEKPFQPTSSTYISRVMAITNPVYVDGDNDGTWTSPHEYAFAAVKRVGTNPAALIPALSNYDEAIAIQAAGLCLIAGKDPSLGEFPARLAKAPQAIQRGFARLIGTTSVKP